jgi:hypothetical protein
MFLYKRDGKNDTLKKDLGACNPGTWEAKIRRIAVQSSK